MLQNPVTNISSTSQEIPAQEEVVENVETEEVTNYAELISSPQEVTIVPEIPVVSDNIYAQMTKEQLFEKLQNHKKLLDNGLILQGEYDALKKEILPFL